MQYLLFKNPEYKFIEWHWSNDQNESATDLFWAHPVGVEQLRAFSGAIVMDCIYKTNMYKYPLLKIIGVTLTHMLLTVAFAFLERKKLSMHDHSIS